MAIYRQVQTSFWTDAKVVDDFTPEDKYFYLYLFTNPHTNLAGCYELSMKVMSDETGYSRETIARILDRLEKVHGVLMYSKNTKEVLILNWYRYNWTASEKFRKPLWREISLVKNPSFADYLTDIFNHVGPNDVRMPKLGMDTVSDEGGYGIDTTVTVSVTDTVPDKGREVLGETMSILSEPVRQKLEEWLAYKKERRESYKPMGLKSLITQVHKREQELGTEAVIQAIDASMANGYKGVFYDKPRASPNKFTAGIVKADYSDFNEEEWIAN